MRDMPKRRDTARAVPFFIERGTVDAYAPAARDGADYPAAYAAFGRPKKPFI